MRKLRAATSREWDTLAKQSQLEVEKALMGLPQFVNLLTGQTGGVHFREITPPCWIACTKGHPIIKVVIAVDRIKGATRGGVWEIRLDTPAPGDEWLPVSQLRTQQTSSGWPDNTEVWGCATEGCKETITWSSDHCAKHVAQPEPTGVEYFDRRRIIICPQPRCIYRGEHRTTNLLVDVAAALCLGKRTARLIH